MPIISSDRITKVYSPRSRTRAVTALSEFSLSVKEGEIFGLLGPNGAGKTTFIKVLLGIVFPTDGSASMLGSVVGNTAAKARAGYLPENHKYPAYLSGEQVLRFFGQLSGMDGASLSRSIDEKLALVDMEKWRGMKTKKYSKGMMQRIGLAQALINDPQLLILDEPTDGVDPLGRKDIRDILMHLKQQGKTIFLNSHLLSEVELICDRVAILNKGKMVRQGTVRELTESEHTYTIGIESALPEALRVQWDATRVQVTLKDGVLLANVADTAALNALIDELRSSGVLISWVTKQRSTLEDMFLKVLSKEAA